MLGACLKAARGVREQYKSSPLKMTVHIYLKIINKKWHGVPPRKSTQSLIQASSLSGQERAGIE